MKHVFSWFDPKFLIIVLAIIVIFIFDTLEAKAPERLVDEIASSDDPAFVVMHLAHADQTIASTAEKHITENPKLYKPALLDALADGGLNERIASMKLICDLNLDIDSQIARVFLESDVIPLSVQGLRYLSLRGEDVEIQRIVDLFHGANETDDLKVIVRYGAPYIKDDEFESFVYEVMSLPEPEIKLVAVEVSGEVEDERAIKILIEALQYTDTLGSVARERIIAMGSFAFPYLMEALEDGRSVVKAQAAELLGELGDKRAFPRLEELFTDLNPEVGASAGRAVGMLASPEQLESLMEIINNARPDSVRALAAISAFGAAGYTEASDRLMQIAADPGFRRSLRRASFIALGEMRLPEAESFFIEIAKNDDEEQILRREAVQALGWFPSPETLRFLTKTLRTDTNFQLRTSAATAFGMMKGNRDALEELILAVDNERTILVLSEIVAALGEHGDQGSIDAIEFARHRGVRDVICDTALAKIEGSG